MIDRMILPTPDLIEALLLEMSKTLTLLTDYLYSIRIDVLEELYMHSILKQYQDSLK